MERASDNGTSQEQWPGRLIHLRPLQTAVAGLGIVTQSLAVGTATEAASTGVLRDEVIGTGGIWRDIVVLEGGSRGVVDVTNLAIVEAQALVRSRRRESLNRRCKTFLAGAALGSYNLRRDDGRSLADILLCSARFSHHKSGDMRGDSDLHNGIEACLHEVEIVDRMNMR